MNPVETQAGLPPQETGGDDGFETRAIEVLVSLRRIIRAVDIHSRRLFNLFQITVPQLMCLTALAQGGPMNLKNLSATVNLGQSTVNGIIDRLEARGLVRRERGQKDRRHVFVNATAAAADVVRQASPLLLQERLAAELRSLPAREQDAIAASLERIVEMMGAAHLDASPLLFSREGIDQNPR